MGKVADISSRRLINLVPDQWVRWVTEREDVIESEPVNVELEFISRRSDAVVRVRSASEGEFLVLTEVQLRYRSEMPYRMNAYAGLVAEKYRAPVYPVLVNILPAAETTAIPHRYESVCLGLVARQDYRVINLWEVDAEVVLSRGLPVVAPFVPVMRGGDKEDVLRRAVELVRSDERMADFEELLGLLAGIRLHRSVIEQIVRMDMSLIRETTWFEEALAEGRQQGLQQGLQEGLQQGLQQQLLRALRHRFGTVSPEIIERLRRLDASRLEELMDVALEADSLDAFARHLLPAGNESRDDGQ